MQQRNGDYRMQVTNQESRRDIYPNLVTETHKVDKVTKLTSIFACVIVNFYPKIEINLFKF